MENSKIEWTDHTINFWWGCLKVSPGCTNCYAESFSKRVGRNIWGPAQTTERWRTKGPWVDCLKWDQKAGVEGVRRKAFCQSMSDFFEDHPQLSAWRTEALEIIESFEWLEVQLLTKRIENVLEMVPQRWLDNWPPHVWIGTSVEDQQRADERIPHLLQIPAKIRFLSCEPLLGPVDLEDLAYEAAGPEWAGYNALVNWVIVGGESGPGARPMHPGWARSLRDQCQGAGIPFFFKQWGNWLPQDQKPNHNECHKTTIPFRQWSDDPLDYSMDVGKKCAGRLLDGVEYSEFPQVEAV